MSEYVSVMVYIKYTTQSSLINLMSQNLRYIAINGFQLPTSNTLYRITNATKNFNIIIKNSVLLMKTSEQLECNCCCSEDNTVCRLLVKGWDYFSS